MKWRKNLKFQLHTSAWTGGERKKEKKEDAEIALQDNTTSIKFSQNYLLSHCVREESGRNLHYQVSSCFYFIADWHLKRLVDISKNIFSAL